MLILAVRLVWIAGFLVGTTTHVIDLVAGGFEAYAGYPDGIRIFWMALTLLDPLVVVLTLVRRRAGVVLGVLVMVADVAVNATTLLAIGGLAPGGVVAQAAFGLVVVATAPLLWRAARRPVRPTKP